jgi:hypothetical protein
MGNVMMVGQLLLLVEVIGNDDDVAVVEDDNVTVAGLKTGNILNNASYGERFNSLFILEFNVN